MERGTGPRGVRLRLVRDRAPIESALSLIVRANVQSAVAGVVRARRRRLQGVGRGVSSRSHAYYFRPAKHDQKDDIKTNGQPRSQSAINGKA